MPGLTLDCALWVDCRRSSGVGVTFKSAAQKTVPYINYLCTPALARSGAFLSRSLSIGPFKPRLSQLPMRRSFMSLRSYSMLAPVKTMLVALPGLILGSPLMYLGFLLLVDLPDKSELKTVSMADIVKVEYSYFKRKGREIPQLSFLTREWGRITVTGGTSAFTVLEPAVNNQEPYSIGFVQERQLFSDSSESYNMVYAVDVNGRAVKSFDNEVAERRVLWGTVFGTGAALVAFSIRRLRKVLRAELKSG
jgi:hypothetical protein